MHLDRSLRRLRMDLRMGIQELLAKRPAGGSPELPDRLLTTGNRRLHNASLLGAGMSSNSSMRALQCIKTAGELGGFKENSTPPAVKPEEPMDWSHEGMGTGGSVRRVPAGGQRGPSRVSATRAGGFPVPRPVPLFSLKPVPSPHLVGWSLASLGSQATS
jgi:hypothetical protein